MLHLVHICTQCSQVFRNMTKNCWFLFCCIFVTQSALSLEHQVQGRRSRSTKTNDETLQVVPFIKGAFIRIPMSFLLSSNLLYIWARNHCHTWIVMYAKRKWINNLKSKSVSHVQQWRRSKWLHRGRPRATSWVRYIISY